MNAKTQQNMTEINRRVAEAVERSVAKGQDRKEAFAAHMKYLAETYPTVFAAYCRWLATPQAS